MNCPNPEHKPTRMTLVRGWESPLALRCTECGEYLYAVGNILCGNRYYKKNNATIDQVREAIAAATPDEIHSAMASR